RYPPDWRREPRPRSRPGLRNDATRAHPAHRGRLALNRRGGSRKRGRILLDPLNVIPFPDRSMEASTDSWRLVRLQLKGVTDRTERYCSNENDSTSLNPQDRAQVRSTKGWTGEPRTSSRTWGGRGMRRAMDSLWSDCPPAVAL